MEWAKVCMWLIWISYIAASRTPVQICQSTKGEQRYKLPEKINCGDKRDYQDWKITLKKKNIMEYKSEAKSLQILERKCETDTSFFNVKTKFLTTTKIKLNVDVAKQLLEQTSCINKEGELRLDELHKEYNCKWKWMSKVITVTWSCYFDKGLVLKVHNGEMRSNIASLKDCVYLAEYCYTTDGRHLKWLINIEEDNEYIMVGTFNATKFGNYMLIEELAMTFKKPNNSKTTWNDREFRLNGSKIITPLKGLKLGVTNTIDALRDELNSRFAYIVNMIQSPKAKASYLCDLYNEMYEAEYRSAKVDPTMYIRKKLNNTLLIAKTVGSYIFVYPCYEINEYKWITENDTCHDGIPIKYRINNTDNYHIGYLKPKYNYIVPRTIQIDCHRRQTILTEVNGEIELHSPYKDTPLKLNMENVVNLQHRPLTGIGFLQDYLDKSWIYTNQDLEHIDLTSQILDYINKELKYGNKINTNGKAGEIINKRSVMWSYFGIFEESAGAMIYGLILWIERLIIWYMIIIKLIIPGIKGKYRKWKLYKYKMAKNVYEFNSLDTNQIPTKSQTPLKN